MVSTKMISFSVRGEPISKNNSKSSARNAFIDPAPNRGRHLAVSSKSGDAEAAFSRLEGRIQDQAGCSPRLEFFGSLLTLRGLAGLMGWIEGMASMPEDHVSFLAHDCRGTCRRPRRSE